MGLLTAEQAEVLIDPALMADPSAMARVIAQYRKEIGTVA